MNVTVQKKCNQYMKFALADLELRILFTLLFMHALMAETLVTFDGPDHVWWSNTVNYSNSDRKAILYTCCHGEIFNAYLRHITHEDPMMDRVGMGQVICCQSGFHFPAEGQVSKTPVGIEGTTQWEYVFQIYGKLERWRQMWSTNERKERIFRNIHHVMRRLESSDVMFPRKRKTAKT